MPEMEQTKRKTILNNADKNTLLAALVHYLETGQGDPENRTAEVHRVAIGETDDQREDVSLDDEGIQELIRSITDVDAIEFE